MPRRYAPSAARRTLEVLGRLVALEPGQADLLDRIVAGSLVALASEEKSGTTDDGPSQ